MNKAKIIIGWYGNGLAVGLEGNKEQIEREFNRFFNWGAAGRNGYGHLHEIGENFSYFLSTKNLILNAIMNENLCKWQDTELSLQYKSHPKSHKKEAGKVFLQHARQAAEDEFESYERENFMGQQSNLSHIYQQLDGGAPSWVSETED